jgi:xanthine dehydrogenase accessory factor
VTAGALALAADLARRGQPFVLATVVWRRGPSSGRQGSKVVVLPDGTVRGWLAGACAEPTVIREAQAAIADGRPRLLFLGPAGELDGVLRDGVGTVPMACESEGAMEIYLDPNLPPPQVVAVGRSPAAQAVTALARALGWRATIVDDEGGAEHPEGVDVATTLDFDAIGVDTDTAIVVATQGHSDEAALQAALATDAGYVGLVASHKRAAAVLDYLRDRGVDDGALARVQAPAGLDLGHVEPDEIGVAILAEIVARKASGALAPPSRPLPAREEATDPVCGMTVDVARARYQTEHAGHTYLFCGAGCQRQFEADPSKYLA